MSKSVKNREGRKKRRRYRRKVLRFLLDQVRTKCVFEGEREDGQDGSDRLK